MNDKQIIIKLKKLKRIVEAQGIISLIAILSICSAPFATYFLLSKENPLYILTIALFIAAIITIVIISKTGKNAEKNLKNFIGENITKDILAERLDIIDYSPSNYIGKKWRDASGILPGYDRISGSDFMEATYKGQNILYCDLKLEYESTDHDGDKSWHTIFKGPFIKIALNQDIQGFVKITEGAHLRSNGFLSGVISGAKDALGIKSQSNTIEVENEAFNRQFKISTNNDQLAFYILTPQFMENILLLDKKAQGNTRINFKGSAVYIAINNNKDSFEINKNIYTVKGLEKAREAMRYDVNVILGMVDEILEKDRFFN